MKHPATAVVLMLAAALVPSATAGKGPHAAPSTSSIAQYVEQLPSATGSVPLGQGSGAVARLSPAAQKALSKSGGSDASTLQKIAVDSQSGAPAESQAGHAPASPTARASAPRGSGNQGTSKSGQGTSRSQGTSKSQSTSKSQGTSAGPTSAVGPAPPAHVPGAVSAAASTVGANSLLALAVVLVAVTAGGVLLARHQRH